MNWRSTNHRWWKNNIIVLKKKKKVGILIFFSTLKTNEEMNNACHIAQYVSWYIFSTISVGVTRIYCLQPNITFDVITQNGDLVTIKRFENLFDFNLLRRKKTLQKKYLGEKKKRKQYFTSYFFFSVLVWSSSEISQVFQLFLAANELKRYYVTLLTHYWPLKERNVSIK